MNLQSGSAVVNGTTLYYELAGSGAPLVLIHGFSLDQRMWDAQFDVFAQQYQVLRYDARGFGKSALPDGTEYNPAEDLKALLDTLGIQRAHILGLSMGGGVAVDFALMYPAATRSLIAVDSVLTGYEWSAAWDDEVKPVWVRGRQSDLEGARRLWLDMGLFKPAHEQPEVKAQLNRIVGDYSGWHWLNRDKTSDAKAFARLERISAPTLSITGERDLPDFHAVAVALERRARAQKVVIPVAGHMAPMEAPQAFNQIVLDFLAGV